MTYDEALTMLEKMMKEHYDCKGTGYTFDENDTEVEDFMSQFEETDDEIGEEDSDDEASDTNSEYEDLDMLEIAFRAAVRTGALEYVENHIEDVDLNDDYGTSSTYLSEAYNGEIESLLEEHGANHNWSDFDDCRFTYDAVNGEVMNYDDDLKLEVFEEALDYYEMTKEQAIRLLSQEEVPEIDEDKKEEFLEDMETIGIDCDEDGKIVPVGSTFGSDLLDAFEKFGISVQKNVDTGSYDDAAAIYYID